MVERARGFWGLGEQASKGDVIGSFKGSFMGSFLGYFMGYFTGFFKGSSGRRGSVAACVGELWLQSGL